MLATSGIRASLRPPTISTIRRHHCSHRLSSRPTWSPSVLRRPTA